MKSTIFYLLLALLILGASCCTDEEEVAPYQGKIKRVLHYGSVENTQARTIDEYQYDSKKRLIKIQNEYQAIVYEYDNDDHLSKAYSYTINGDNYLLSNTTSYRYTYKDGKLVSKETNSVSPNASTIYHYREVYEYENARPIKCKFYYEHNFEKMAVYEYTGDLMTKEIVYRDSLGVKVNTITGHHYDENNKLAVTSKAYATATYMAWFQSIYYFYNSHGDLDMEYAEQSDDISAGITFCRRYEYY